MALNEPAIRTMKDLESALSQYRAIVPQVLQAQGVQELALIKQAHLDGRYFSKDGDPVQIRDSGVAWKRKKEIKDWSSTRGIASGVLLEVAARPSVIRKTAWGYNFRKLEQVSVRVKNVARFFMATKAPGYMNMKRGYQERHRAAVNAATNEMVRRILKGSVKIGGTGQKHQVKITLQSIFQDFKLTRLPQIPVRG